MALIYTFRGTLHLVGALHVGNGGSNDATDATVVRDVHGQPYIPGSSLRGAFRAAVERLSPPLLGLAPAREMTVLEQRLGALLETLRDEQAVQHMLDEELTTVERLFGTTYWASPLTIPDLPLESGTAEAQEIRHGVGIDRDTGTAKEQIKYDFEVVPRDHTFAFLMRCEMVPHYQTEWERLLAIGLRLLEQGELPLGGRVARGVGHVRLVDMKVFTLDTTQKKELLAAFLSDRPNAHDGTQQPDGWTTRVLQEL